MVDIWFFSVWFFSSVQVGFSFVKITTKLFSPHPVSYWVVSDMRDTFSFFFLWLEVWCISFFYKQSVAFIIRRQYIIIEALLDLNEFENHVNIHYVFLEGKWKFSKTVSIKKNRNTFFLTTLWPNENPFCDILFIFWSWMITWDFDKQVWVQGGIHHTYALCPL